MGGWPLSLLSEDGCFQGPEGFGKNKNHFLPFFFFPPLPWLWYFVFGDCCPHRIWGFLFFKPSSEYFFNVIHAKCTHGRPRNAAKGDSVRESIRQRRLAPGSQKQAHYSSRSSRALFSPVELCGEHPDHSGDAIDLYDVGNGLQNIEVEKGISRDRAVEPSLQKRGPVFLQDPLGATHVIFTDAGHTGIHGLPRGGKQSHRVMCREGEWK